MGTGLIVFTKPRQIYCWPWRQCCVLVGFLVLWPVSPRTDLNKRQYQSGPTHIYCESHVYCELLTSIVSNLFSELTIDVIVILGGILYIPTSNCLGLLPVCWLELSFLAVRQQTFFISSNPLNCSRLHCLDSVSSENSQ